MDDFRGHYAIRGAIPPSWARDAHSLHFGGGLLLTVPLPSATYPNSLVPGGGVLTFWRISLLHSDLLPPKPMSVEFIQSQLDRIQDDFRVEIAALLNGNRYYVRNAVAEQLYKPMGLGHVLLAGDAAHVHSPAGGQGLRMLSDTARSSHRSYYPFIFLFPGLNLGMCDAIALAKTISEHIKTQDAQVLLNYSSNRRARAIQVVEISSGAMSTLVRLMKSTFLR